MYVHVHNLSWHIVYYCIGLSLAAELAIGDLLKSRAGVAKKDLGDYLQGNIPRGSNVVPFWVLYHNP